jgi:hypothetical protein
VRTRLILAAAVCILALPLWFSTSTGNNPTNSGMFSPVAYAGHTTGGYWCECGTQGCICDPGELPIGRAASDPNKTTTSIGTSSTRQSSGFDAGTGALMLVLVLFVWTRLRA